MSLVVKFDFYDSEGNELYHNKTVFNSYNDISNLNYVHKRLIETISELKLNSKVQYASPCHAGEYMFDILHGGLLPNKFLKW